MNGLVTLEMLMDKALADELTQKGLAEIALRRADAKFKAMVKCNIVGSPVPIEDILEKVSTSGLNTIASNTYNMEQVRRNLYSLARETTFLSSSTKDMASQVDVIYRNFSTINGISYLNTGLSLANTAVNVAGFVIIAEKLNALDSEVQSVANNVNKIANIQKNEIISECQILIMQSNSMFSSIKDEETIDLRIFEDLLIRLKTFISKLVRNLYDNSLSKDLALEMIFILLPAYTGLLCEYTKRYYFQKKSAPPNYNNFLALYDEIQNTTFVDILKDYFILEKKMHINDVVDMLNGQTLLVYNGKGQVEDQLLILEKLETKEKIIQFESELEKSAKNRVEELQLKLSS